MAYVYLNPQRKELLEAEQQLQYWLQQREYATQQIASLQQRIAILKPIVEGFEEFQEEPSLPFFCLQLMSMAPQAVYSVPLIRDGLKMFLGVEVTGTNPLGILHTVLGRLVQNRYVRHVPQPGGPTLYQITTAGKLFLQGKEG
jgi:hypothetical protein